MLLLRIGRPISTVLIQKPTLDFKFRSALAPDQTPPHLPERSAVPRHCQLI